MPTEAKCIVCDRNSQQVPILTLQYQENTYWICPQHLPVLIHNPEQLADKLPGLENIAPAEGHHH
jgi:hypothetical protein